MNFTKKLNPWLINNNYTRRSKKNKAEEESLNAYNQKILDLIIDDEDDKFIEIVSQVGDIKQINRTFSMTNYKMPNILRNNPTYASLCAFFNSEKCYNSLSMLFPAGQESEEMKQTDDFGRGPIHFACAGGNLNIIRELEQHEYSLNEADNEGCLPSHYAAMNGHLDVFKYLWVKGADLISSSSKTHMTPLHVASLYGHLNIVKFICETVVGSKSGDDEKENKKELMNFAGFHNIYCKYSTPIHLACEGGHEDVLNYLLSIKDLADIQINSLDNKSRTPLNVACKNGSLSCVKALVNTGKALKKMKNRKHYPLIDASAGGFLDIILFLLKNKVDIHQVSSQKIDAITAAVINDHINVVKCLIENNALKNYTSEKLGDLFLCACGTNDINMIAFLDKSFEVPYDEKSNNKVFRWSLTSQLKLDENSKWSTQYMQQACLLENEEMVKFLLNKNITFDGVDFSMNTQKKWSPFLDFLIQQGVNLSECVNSEGVPPIVATVKGGSLNNVKKMIKKGTKLDADIITKFKLILSTCSNLKKDLFDFLMSYKPVIDNPEECIERLMCSYGRNSYKENRFYMAEEILTKGNADVNKELNNHFCSQNLVSRAVDIRSFEFLDLFVKYGADFTKVPLRFDQLSLKRDIKLVEYLKDHGCTFNHIVTYKNPNYFYNINKGNNTPLTQSFYLISYHDYNPEFPSLLIDYISDDEIENIKNGKESVMDKLISCNCFDGILKIYQKCNKVIYPDDMSKEDYIQCIKESNCKELIDLVLNDSK